MGSSFYVPRSVKGESRILYIFTIKSFIVTLIFGLVGAGIWFLLTSFNINVELVPGLIIVGIFGGIGYALATVIIPDVPFMGPLRKAGGENIGAMILRLISFRGRKKIYLYNYKRENIKGGTANERGHN